MLYSPVLCIQCIVLCVLQGLTDMYMWINIITQHSLPSAPDSSPWSKYLYNSSCKKQLPHSSLPSSSRSGSQCSDYSLHTPVPPLLKFQPQSSTQYGQHPPTTRTPPRHTPMLYTLHRPDLIQLSSSRAKERRNDCTGLGHKVKKTYSEDNSIIEDNRSDRDNMNDDYSLLCDELLENDDPDHKFDDSDLNYKSNKHLSYVNTINRGGE